MPKPVESLEAVVRRQEGVLTVEQRPFHGMSHGDRERNDETRKSYVVGKDCAHMSMKLM